jgi:capsule polysaccharide export protein KpsE/RkpR
MKTAPVRQPIHQDDNSSSATQPIAATNRSILPHVELLWEQRRFVFTVALYALLASALVAYLIPTRYESTARLMPPDNSSTSGLAMAAAAMTGGAAGAGLGSLASDVLGLKSSSDVFVGVLGSRTVQDKLIEQFSLKKIYHDSRMEDARKDLANHTSVSVERKSQIISIMVVDHSAERAAAMAQAYVAELNRLVAELSTSSARRERIFLEGRLQTAETDLKAAEKDFSEFASKNAAIDVKEQGKAMVEAAATLQGELIAAESQYQGLRQIYTDQNPRVRSVKARIDELQRQLNKLGGKGESTVSLPGAGTGVEGGSGDDASLYPSIRKLPLLGVTYADLYRRTKIQEVVLETLTREYEMAKVQEAKEIPVVKVLDAAYVPDKKSFPPRLLIMFAGTTLAVCGAVLWILGKAGWDRVDPDDQRKIFAQHVFAEAAAGLPAFVRKKPAEESPSSLSTFRRRPD